MSERPTRAELERALRRVHLEIAELRGQMLELAAQVVALTRAGDEDAILAATEPMVEALREQDERSTALRAELGEGFLDKYELPELGIPCEELIPLCKARCCSLRFCLSTQDLDEGLVRWDYGRPYLNLVGDDGFCTHLDGARGCTVYANRPAPCRQFDCRNDARIWADYDKRIPATAEERERAHTDHANTIGDASELAHKRASALAAEMVSLRREE